MVEIKGPYASLISTMGLPILVRQDDTFMLIEGPGFIVPLAFVGGLFVLPQDLVKPRIPEINI